MFGSIMPEPLAVPPTVNEPRGGLTRDGVLLRERVGGHDGARRVAAAAIGASADGACGCRSPRCPWQPDADDAGGCDQHLFWRAAERAPDVARPFARAFASPSSPVQAFAQPLLTTTARADAGVDLEMAFRDEDGRSLREVRREDAAAGTGWSVASTARSRHRLSS